MAANKKQKSMEETLWDSANKLRGTVSLGRRIQKKLLNVFKELGYEL